MAASHIFKVQFVNQGKVYEIYARKVSHGGLFGFIEVEELVFGERSTVQPMCSRTSTKPMSPWRLEVPSPSTVTDPPVMAARAKK